MPRVPVGIVGERIEEVERSVPPDEPPVLPVNSALAVIGKRTPRIDGRLKVTGAARYTADVRLPGMLHARIVRSPYAHAHVRSIDTSRAERHPAVRAVHVLDHLLDSAELRDKTQEEPSRFPVVRYVGQPICAVAALTQDDADEAAALVDVQYESLPFVVDVDDARRPGSPLVYPGPVDDEGSAGGGSAPAGLPQSGNVRGPAVSGPSGGPPCGDVQAGFAAAEVIVEGTYRTQVQTHSALETHGVVADWKEDGLTVYASTQGTSTVQNELAAVFGIPKSRVRVITEFMGGGFGAKFGAGSYGVLAAYLSRKAHGPVRLMLERKEEHVATGNRPSSIQLLRIGARTDGTLTAIHFRSYGTAGVGTGSGCGGPAQDMYPCPNVLVEESDVFTHAGAAAAFRAPGYPQGTFALEQSIDELAERLRMDPVLLRDRIDVDAGRSGQNSDARRIERRLGAERIGWSRRHAPGKDAGPVQRGLGMAQAIWYRYVDLDASCEVRIHRDGSIEVLSAVQDIGGGIRTALAQVVAEELKVRPEAVTVRIGDTAYPNGPPSGASKTTGSITPPARVAAYRASAQLPREGASLENRAAKLSTEYVAGRACRAEDYGGFAGTDDDRNYREGKGGMGGVQFAEVAVDVETGVIKVERVVAVHDCGRPINPLAVESQVNGGVLQGLSYALYEERILDRRSGWMLNPNFEQYKIAGARETPLIEVLLIEQYRGTSATDAGGIGEPATVPTAAAIANAVYNATGVRMRELPMTPARVLAALAAAKAGAK